MLLYVNGQAPVYTDITQMSVAICAVVSLSVVGSLLSIHQPANPIGWIFLTVGISIGVLIAADNYALYLTRTAPDDLSKLALLFWPAGWLWVSAFLLPAIFGILLFPTGALPSRKWRAFAWAAAIWLVFIALDEMFLPGPLLEPAEAYPQLTNPVAIPALDLAFDALYVLQGPMLIAFLVGACVSIFRRFRTAAGIERQQIKWFAFAAILPIVGLCFTVIASAADSAETQPIAGIATGIGITLLPVTIGIAILRHNLYDIDRLINRTLVYGSLTALLLLGFAANVLLFQLILEPFIRGNDLAVAGSTLVVFTLSRPLRNHLQSFIDRRFYRSKYDAARALTGFSERLRNETDLNSLSHELCSVVQQTVRPQHMSLWLRRSTTVEEEL